MKKISWIAAAIIVGVLLFVFLPPCNCGKSLPSHKEEKKENDEAVKSVQLALKAAQVTLDSLDQLDQIKTDSIFKMIFERNELLQVIVGLKTKARSSIGFVLSPEDSSSADCIDLANQFSGYILKTDSESKASTDIINKLIEDTALKGKKFEAEKIYSEGLFKKFSDCSDRYDNLYADYTKAVKKRTQVFAVVSGQYYDYTRTAAAGGGLTVKNKSDWLLAAKVLFPVNKGPLFKQRIYQVDLGKVISLRKK
jgi:hypothetical protein